MPSSTADSDQLLRWLKKLATRLTDNPRMGITVAEAAEYLGVSELTARLVLQCDDRFITMHGYWQRAGSFGPKPFS